MPHNPLDDLARREAQLRALLFGKYTGGVFGAVRQPPQSLAFLRGVRLGRAADIQRGRWWSGIWGRARDRIVPLAVNISRESGSAAWREFAAGFAEERARELAVELARERAEALVAELASSTGEGLVDVVRDLSRRDILLGDLREELAGRLGPTRLQLERIRRWETAQRAAGVGRAEILAGARARARNAVRLRADVIASDTLTAQVNASRSAVFAESGLLVFSANVGDDRVRALHRTQTVVTAGEPRPAGEPWAPSAPFSGLPPYEIRCRCWVAASGK